jgi:ABC-type nickel/cobalt efflux system permease component RcnA
MLGRVRPRRPLLRALAALTGVVATLAVPAVVLAHPLGNFTINTYSGLRVSPTRIDIDLVLDEAEIPTFQDRLRLDLDGDGELSQAEIDAAREPECRDFAKAVELTVGGSRVTPVLVATGLSFPAGAGGLSTMRLVCELVAPLDSPLTSTTRIAFANHSHAERIGWREIVVQGDGVTILPGEQPIPSQSVSARLTSYPTDMLTQPLSATSIDFDVTPGGASLPPFAVADAQPLAGVSVPTGSVPSPRAGTAGSGPAQAAIPGGVGSEIPSVFRASDLSPAVVLLALATALVLGAGHALTPGHGKTLMAAYLVGTRGTALHAAGLGLSVTVSHTLGILALAIVVVAAQGVLPPDVVVRFMPAIAALTIVAIGAWMLGAEFRRRRAARRLADHRHDHIDDQVHDHAHDRLHEHPHEHAHEGSHEHPHEDALATEHSHGGVRHTHLPPQTTSITWRSLFLLGLAGGIIPSTNALLILLGTIAVGRTAFGVILVIAFGLGMAVVLGGVGLALVYARGRLDRLAPSSRLGRLSSAAPLVASVVVLALGVWLTEQAFLARPLL